MSCIQLIATVLLLSLCQLSHGHGHWNRDHRENREHREHKWQKSHDWDHFMFAQAWPPATCADGTRVHHTCNVAVNVSAWTIHGLWPSLGSTRGPTSCNNSWHFDFSKIEYLKDDLEKYWPNLYNDTTLTSFWAHEWSKHGTCCSDLPATSGEENYFKSGLDMNKKYNITQMLADSGVIPSNTATYSYFQFSGAIKLVIGVEPQISCTMLKLKDGSSVHSVDQIKICLNKEFGAISCDSNENDLKFGDWKGDKFRGQYSSSCPTSKNFYYPPIQHPDKFIPGYY